MEDKKSRKNKITKYPRGIHIPIVMLIFLFILIYLIISIVNYLNSKHIVGYEVKAGSLSSDNTLRPRTLFRSILSRSTLRKRSF